MIASTIVDGQDLERIKLHAEKAWINGKSWVRGSDRVASGPEDQLVGQLGEYALAKYLGDKNSYFSRRERIDLTPERGDDGSDFDGTKIDVKSSMMRAGSDPLRYNLLVRPRERHQDNLYVLALVKPVDTTYKVMLVGVARDDEFPDKPESSGTFSGAYRIPACKLSPPTDLRRLLLVGCSP